MSRVEVYEDSSGEMLGRCVGLAKAHYYEVEEKSSAHPFNLNLELITSLSDLGVIQNVVAVKDGEVVGYFTNTVSPCVFTGGKVAKELGIYLHPNFRGGSTFLRMVKLAETLAKEAGCYSQLLAFKKGHDFGLAERLGYGMTETIYQKFLGD